MAPMFLGAVLLVSGCTYDFDRYDPLAASDGAAMGVDVATGDVVRGDNSPDAGGDSTPDGAGPSDSGGSGDESVADSATEDTGADALDDAIAGPDSAPPDAAVPVFTVGGTVGGLRQGRRVVLQDNGGDNLTVSANGPFVFAQSVASGATYRVSVFKQPQNQMCNVMGGTGTVGMVNITTVSVVCQ
jgi:hypothetical protein